MNRLQLFKELRLHRRLAEKRALNYEQNKGAKIATYIGLAFGFLYFIFIAIMLSLAANSMQSITPMEFIFAVMPFFLVVDFAIRFVAQQTPAQLIKPYVLLPISRYACIDTFIATSMLNTGNLIWFGLFLPYALMSLIYAYPIWITIEFLFICWVLILIDTQWYLIAKTKITDSQLWWLLPIAIYAVMAAPILLKLGKSQGWDDFFDLYATIGTAVENGSPLPLLIMAALLILLIYINRRMQYSHVWRELARVEVTKLRSVSRLSFLDRFGQIGEYLKLEIKSIIRNKNPRKTFISGAVTVCVFVALISFTDLYDGDLSANFWCVYCYVLLGTMNVIKVMGPEGNYIDGLMVHKENILSLLHAKYIFNCVMLIFPFLLMLPAVFAGKWSLLMLISYGVFTAGFQMAVLFQMAVYNKQTIPLNEKFIDKSGAQTNYTQLVASAIAFAAPVFFVSILQNLTSENTSYVIMLAIGLVFVLTSRLWLRNIYNRLMRRRYVNMESFRASR